MRKGNWWSLGPGFSGKLLQHSMIEESSNGRRMSLDGRLSLELGKVEFLKDVPQASDVNSLNESNGNCDLTISDTDSVSSGRTNGLQESPWTMKPKIGPRVLLMYARFWQETNSRLRLPPRSWITPPDQSRIESCNGSQ
ncbi:hypothetical protein SAY86_022843 [Trapa natans]|uniref:Uncharacterized protein n=1 Tax=Trapa natans TaxID=22666 RepID=A0AAN7RB06_TRANT|nr:hypothetical protein SAY86_022843 [Trapa natans]